VAFPLRGEKNLSPPFPERNRNIPVSVLFETFFLFFRSITQFRISPSFFRAGLGTLSLFFSKERWRVSQRLLILSFPSPPRRGLVTVPFSFFFCPPSAAEGVCRSRALPFPPSFVGGRDWSLLISPTLSLSQLHAAAFFPFFFRAQKDITPSSFSSAGRKSQVLLSAPIKWGGPPPLFFLERPYVINPPQHCFPPIFSSPSR